MGKNVLILGVTSAVVVIACGAGGAIYALNASSDSTPSKATANYELKKEQAKQNGWNQKDGDWYYYKDDKVQTGWVQDNGSWYYCDDSGKMKLNWLQDKSKWYYLGSDGKLRTGWIKDSDKWYYMNNDGTMAVNTTIDGCYLNQDGIIVETPAKKKENDSEASSNNRNAPIVITYTTNSNGDILTSSYPNGSSIQVKLGQVIKLVEKDYKTNPRILANLTCMKWENSKEVKAIAVGGGDIRIVPRYCDWDKQYIYHIIVSN
ncbi:hypothetical protein B0P06_006073 [Clostridium saccharoperbutylacetonicum]|uniref:Cell wall binding repeat-containing protein n=1 Tax=Clostridium saccharoperbutylacetonicum N1-4(HMT) TaxID=931276 RepID=M1N8K1_9CLOT|nr:hypothetical protein [Clostridium saccharoperbutylacetonicum]AGF59652.1 hypothetical protein Cspa_135p00920 [Clostridium saccharoperbutylacetonicum N1-4(HMT)]NRT64598.1 hypothetical protein [Clostridium saccharoperbutylacetonicum]NSB28966.1 hypothetical protein [Clostridium saccharoperbutylacetonicum]NSB46180.1 hypothetical protein [Clostridium saccharoperbutylacetonicum]